MKSVVAKAIAGLLSVAVSAAGIVAYNANSTVHDQKVETAQVEEADVVAASDIAYDWSKAAEKEGFDESKIQSAEDEQAFVESLQNEKVEKTDAEKKVEDEKKANADTKAKTGNIAATAAPVVSAKTDTAVQSTGVSAKTDNVQTASQNTGTVKQTETNDAAAEKAAAEKEEAERLQAEKEALEASEIISSVVIIEDPKPVIKKIIHWNCVCGFDCTSKEEYQQHALEGIRRGEQHNYHNWTEEVEVYE